MAYCLEGQHTTHKKKTTKKKKHQLEEDMAVFNFYIYMYEYSKQISTMSIRFFLFFFFLLSLSSFRTPIGVFGRIAMDANNARIVSNDGHLAKPFFYTKCDTFYSIYFFFSYSNGQYSTRVHRITLYAALNVLLTSSCSSPHSRTPLITSTSISQQITMYIVIIIRLVSGQTGVS